jgi:hypothetical protein
VGWTEGVDYDFKCLNSSTTAVIEDMAGADPECDMAVASITITSQRQDLGIQFAFPYYSSSVSIMVKGDSSSSSGWTWIQPFATDLWVAIVVTMLVWPLLLYLIEAYSFKPKVHVRDVYYGVEEASWRSLWTLQHGGTLDVTSLGARITALCFSFLALIIGSSYTANLAAFLTVKNVNAIRSIYDLGGLSTASVPVYIPLLRSNYGLLSADAGIADIDDVRTTAGLVARGSLAAFLYDDVVSSYVTATFPGCAVRILKDKVQPFDYGVAFKKGFNSTTIDFFSEAILRAQERGDVARAEDRYLLKSSPCLVGAQSTANGIERIAFKSVYGLWVILLAGLVVGIVIMAVVRSRRNRQWKAAAETLPGHPAVATNAHHDDRVAKSTVPRPALAHIASDLDDVKSVLVPEHKKENGM